MARDAERYREYQREWKRQDRLRDPEKHKKYHRDFYERNRDVILQNRKEYQEKNRGPIQERKRKKYADRPFSSRKDETLRRVYGIGLDDYEAMCAEQLWRCAICGHEAKLFVDHCHESGKVRGLLCQHCNFGIGHFRENKEVMLSAIAYLIHFS